SDDCHYHLMRGTAILECVRGSEDDWSDDDIEVWLRYAAEGETRRDHDDLARFIADLRTAGLARKPLPNVRLIAWLSRGRAPDDARTRPRARQEVLAVQGAIGRLIEPR